MRVLSSTPAVAGHTYPPIPLAVAARDAALPMLPDEVARTLLGHARCR